MEVILTANIKKLGKVGDIVNVKSGYARNFLFINNKAIRKTSENLKNLENQKKEIEEKELKIRADAEEIIEKIKNIKLEFTKEADENGQLYGSVKTREILEALKEKSINLESDSIIIKDQIKMVGEFTIEINPYHDLSENLKIIINSSKEQ
tara:strand:+ start:138 stop:590 length:453 start_codon:yes stop_codon:yes gene_type:complete